MANKEKDENILEVRNLNKNYKGFKLKDINLTLPKGMIMGLIGENGAGKTTTIKSILNLTKVDSGEVGLPISNNGLVLPCGIYGRWQD